MAKETQTNIVSPDPDAIRLVNLDQLRSNPSCFVRLQIGFATFQLRWKDVAALNERLAKPSHEIVIAKCHFTLSTGGHKLLRTVVEQAIHAKTTCEQRQSQTERKEYERTRQQQVEAEWLRCMRDQ